MTHQLVFRVQPRTIVGRYQHGFTLIELMITIVIISILAAIALPSYQQSIAKTRRRAAQLCLSNYATSMERYYTTNLKYGNSATSAAFTLPSLDCGTSSNSGNFYTFTATATTATFSLTATPSTNGGQSTRDASCGTLTLDQKGTRGLLISGTAGTAAQVASCW